MVCCVNNWVCESQSFSADDACIFLPLGIAIVVGGFCILSCFVLFMCVCVCVAFVVVVAAGVTLVFAMQELGADDLECVLYV